MSEDYDVNIYEPDVQAWVLKQMEGDVPMYAGEAYKNSAGHMYKVLEDSLNSLYVKVISDYPVNSIRIVAKAVVLF